MQLQHQLWPWILLTIACQGSIARQNRRFLKDIGLDPCSCPSNQLRFCTDSRIWLGQVFNHILVQLFAADYERHQVRHSEQDVECVGHAHIQYCYASWWKEQVYKLLLSLLHTSKKLSSKHADRKFLTNVQLTIGHCSLCVSSKTRTYSQGESVAQEGSGSNTVPCLRYSSMQHT